MRALIDRSSAFFLFLSVISGVTELGLVFMGLAHHLPLAQVVALGLSYQLGNLVPNPLALGTRARTFAAVLGAGAAGVVALHSFHVVPLFAAGALLGAVIQSLRRLSKDSVSTTVKRTFRILGFLLAPLLTVPWLLAIGLTLLLAALGSREQATPTRLRVPRLGFMTLIMVVHQMHYFSYVYFIVPIVRTAAHDSPLVTGIYFAMGWMTYTSVAHLLRGKRYAQYFMVGHLGLTGVLLAISLATSPELITLLWVITGFGGGTVFCLERINEHSHELAKADIGFAENAGHVLGVAAGMVAYASSSMAQAPVLVACGSALGACALLFVYTLQRRRSSGAALS